jgi:hypothetical protein
MNDTTPSHFDRPLPILLFLLHKSTMFFNIKEVLQPFLVSIGLNVYYHEYNILMQICYHRW